MRRYNGNMKGEQHCGNSNKNEVHDLDNEQTNCQIDKIIKAGHDVPFSSLVTAHFAGYDNCSHCLGSSKR